MSITTTELIDRMLDPIKPATPEWYATVSASKVAAIMGLSPWTSKFTLWHLMAGNITPDDGDNTTERGTYLETAVIAWFRDKHPELDVFNGASFRHPEHNDWTATPDALATDGTVPSAVEAKSSQYTDEWGEPGTAQIPPYYLVQALWQMVVTGLRTVYFPVLFGQPFEFRLYTVRWADVAADVPNVIAEVEAFQASLASGVPPRIDASDSTYQSVRKLHPDIDGGTVNLPDSLAYTFLIAKIEADSAEQRMKHAKNQIADHMGTAKKAEWAGATIFTRQSKNGGTPYLVVGRSLPDPENPTPNKKAA